MLIPASASGGKFTDLKALKLSESTFVALLPLISILSKQMHTSGTRACPSLSFAAAISTDDIRFSLPSVLGAPIGSWLPVNITGFVRFPSIKLRADAE